MSAATGRLEDPAQQMGLFVGHDLPGWPFGDLEPFSFGAIHVDPPWRFDNWSAKGEDRNPSSHYETMSLDEIAALPVSALAAKNCALFLWTIGPLADKWPMIMKAWGFEFSGKAFCWAKPYPKSANGVVADLCSEKHWVMGLGYGSRANTEDCWLGTIGSPTRIDAGVRELIVEPLREHSRKPEQVYGRIERLFAGPYLDLFSRQSRHGWSNWGREKDKFDGARKHAP